MITDREKILAIVDNDCLTPSDAVILLEGDAFSYWVASPSFPFEEVKPFILEGGVPEEDLIHEDVSQHTRQQAIEVIKMAMTNGWKKLALVASHEHQYRAYLTFLREVLDTKSGIILYNAPVRNLNWFVDSGWGIRFERLSVEFERIERYSALGHLANADEVVEYQKWKESLLNQ